MQRERFKRGSIYLVFFRDIYLVLWLHVKRSKLHI